MYPYLLRHLRITRSNHVWAADITYIPIKRGFVYLFAVLDWASRWVLAWRLSNTLTPDFCMEAVQDAMIRYGAPEIFNTGLLTDHGIQISMDGKDCWRDNVFVERLWKSVKYEGGLSTRLRHRERCTERVGAVRHALQSAPAAFIT